MVAAFRARTGVARQGRSSEWMFGHTPLHLQGGNGGTGVVTRWRGREGQYSWRRSGRRAGMMGGEGIETAACKLQKIRALAILQIWFLFYRFDFTDLIFYLTDLIFILHLFYRFDFPFYFTDFIFYFTDLILQILIFILQILFCRFYFSFYRFYFYILQILFYFRQWIFRQWIFRQWIFSKNIFRKKS